MDRLEHRASDAERDAAADRIRVAGGDGRLEADELEERLEAAYSARTVGELERLVDDLPAPAPEPPGREPVWHSHEVRARLASFIVVNTVCVAIWLATGADGGFWPGWVMLGTGIALFARIVRTALGVEERHGRGNDQPDLPGLPDLPAPPGLPGSARRRARR